MVTGEADLVTQAIICCSGRSAVYAASGVKVYQVQLLGSVINVPMDAVTSVLKYTRRLDFTTGKRVDRGDELLRNTKQ